MHAQATPPKESPLKRKAYEAILESILGGKLEPGALLNRRGVAHTLGMSVAPVHEAMLQLEGDGFLEAIPRVGTRVRVGTREEVRGHLVVREALESHAVRMVCGAGAVGSLERLATLAEAVDASGASELCRARREVAFHVAVVELAGCPTLTREYRRVMQVGLFYRITSLMGALPDTPLKRHRELLDALAARDSEAAAACVREHIWFGKPESLKSGRTA
jgi:DNA-binding GntR family transcriptional regulator